ncbi:MAG: ParA family protein [Nitrospinae bacterium]|nr:ParA family protein [Nitrospinota bacterium]
MDTIAIINQKGGVGKTTTAINLAASLATTDKKVLIVDMDPQGNASTGLGIRGHEKSSSVYLSIIGEVGLDAVIRKTEVENLDVAPSNINLAGAEVELNNFKDKEFRLKEELDKMHKKYDVVLIDCPPSLSILTVNALTASNYILIPLQCEFYSMDGLSKLLKTFNAIKSSLNNNLQILGILLTMHDKRTILSNQVKEEIEKHFPELVLKSIIPRNVKLSEAPSYALPIIHYDPSSKGADAHIDLAKEIIQRLRRNN